MTGYGKGAAENSNFSVEAEVKSINGRYLDVYLKLPFVITNKEYELRELIKSKIRRGKLTTTILIKLNGKNDALSGFNKEKLKTYIQLLKDLKKSAKINEKIKIEHLLMNRDLFLSEEVELKENDFQLVKNALNTALEDLLVMKKKEGKELEKDLHSRIINIDEKLLLIEKESKQSVEEYFQKLKDKVKLLVEDITEYSDRLELELAIIADKAEITEECVRLRSHLKFFIESLQKEEDPGRKLNFLCQEMNREANTISSKTVSTSITHNTVLIKEEIEKIREQLQNIE
jgi:uncharacterized protein (TIGR00255 family)